MSVSLISGNALTNSYAQLSSGIRITSAAVDPAGLSIANKLNSQSNSYQVGINNAATSQNMVNIADGALGSIGDYLQRIRELSVKASNTAVYGDAERQIIQDEIEQMKQGIADVAKITQFNTMNLFDGTKEDSKVATNPDGSGMETSIPKTDLETLGIKDYDVTERFDISTIDDAIEKVSSARSSLGASSNRLDQVMSYNADASFHLTGARSRIEDLDMPKAISELKKNEVMQQFQLMLEKKKREHEADGHIKLLQ